MAFPTLQTLLEHPCWRQAGKAIFKVIRLPIQGPRHAHTIIVESSNHKVELAAYEGSRGKAIQATSTRDRREVFEAFMFRALWLIQRILNAYSLTLGARMTQFA